eukprot:EG_transcript_39305
MSSSSFMNSFSKARVFFSENASMTFVIGGFIGTCSVLGYNYMNLRERILALEKGRQLMEEKFKGHEEKFKGHMQLMEEKFKRHTQLMEEKFKQHTHDTAHEVSTLKEEIKKAQDLLNVKFLVRNFWEVFSVSEFSRCSCRRLFLNVDTLTVYFGMLYFYVRS